MGVNLKTLSKSLGLSETTVSRGLNGYSDVSESTRKRIIEAAKRMNYSPNVRAKGLATGRSMVIGNVIPKSSKHEMINPIFGDFVSGASSVYAQHGYNVLMVRDVNDDESLTYRKLFVTGAVDGVMIQGPSIKDERISLLLEIGLPFVVHGRSSGIEADYSWVDVNNRRSFDRATQFLLDLGHRRIALLNGLEHMDFAQRRRQGFLDAFQKSGVEPAYDLMLSAEMTEDFGYRETSRLLSQDPYPTAILASSYITALGVKRAIGDRGLKLGADISVVTHDDELSYLPNGAETPIFTCTRSSVSRAGALLAEMLIGQIAGNQTSHVQKLLEAELIIGQSTGPVKG